MRLSWATACVCILVLFVFVQGTTEAAMVDFEAPAYTAGSGFVGVDGWVNYLTPTTVITPDGGGSGDTRVLAGAQSGRLSGGLSIVLRPFDAGPAAFDTGTIVSGHMLASGTAGGTGEFFFSQNVATLGTPAGIVGNLGGNFDLFGKSGSGVVGNIGTGVPFLANVDYLLEIELDLGAQSFSAYATNVTSPGPRMSLGSAFFAGSVSPASYTTGGFALISRANAVAVYDDLDIDVVAPNPLLPGVVDFEAPVYVAGQSIVGVDGWYDFLGATAIVTPDPAGSGDVRVLEGSKSVRLSGARSIVQRSFGPGTTYEQGSIIRGRMMLDGPAGSHGEFFFSHSPTNVLTPAGIIGIVGGNFFVFGLKDGKVVSANGIDTGVPVLSNVDYLLEVELDLENQTFDSYVTNLTAGDPRVSLGTAEFWTNDTIVPGDGRNGGFVLVTRGSAVGIFDQLSVVPEPSTLAAVVGLLLGSAVVAWRRREA